MADVVTFTCQSCTYEGEALESDGFYYCSACGEKNLDVVDTGAEEEDAIGAGIYLASHQRRTAAPTDAVYVQPISQCNPSQSNFLRKLGLEDDSQVKVKAENVDQSQCDSSNPADFGGSAVVSIEQYYKEIRLRYIMGLQMMIELQCEALVKEFKVTPLICGLVGPIWLRFVSKTGVFDDDWADKAIHDSEMQNEGNNVKFSFLLNISATLE